MKREWCHKIPFSLKSHGIVSSKQSIKLAYEYPDILPSEIRKQFPKRVMCPDCKQKFKPRIRECDDIGCWHMYIPAHKKKSIVKRKTSRDIKHKLR